jgi:hypothetical protein
MRVGRQDVEITIWDLAAVQVGRRGRDADIGVGWVAVATGSRRGGYGGRYERRFRRHSWRWSHIGGPLLAIAGLWRPQAALLLAGVALGLPKGLLIVVGR